MLSSDFQILKLGLQIFSLNKSSNQPLRKYGGSPSIIIPKFIIPCLLLLKAPSSQSQNPYP